MLSLGSSWRTSVEAEGRRYMLVMFSRISAFSALNTTLVNP